MGHRTTPQRAHKADPGQNVIPQRNESRRIRFFMTYGLKELNGGFREYNREIQKLRGTRKLWENVDYFSWIFEEFGKDEIHISRYNEFGYISAACQTM